MDTYSRALEIRVISGEGLRLNRRQPVKKNAFVIIQTDSINAVSTKIDKEGGSYPNWNEKIVVNMPLNLRNITVEVQCKAYSGNKVVGTARIPVSDFVGGYIPANYLHFLSYRLRDGKGERNGIINLSVRVKGNDDFAPRVNAREQNDGFAPGYLKVAANDGGYGGSNGWRNNMAPENGGYGSNYSRRYTGTTTGGRVSSRVVTGVPLWHTYQA